LAEVLSPSFFWSDFDDWQVKKSCILTEWNDVKMGWSRPCAFFVALHKSAGELTAATILRHNSGFAKHWLMILESGGEDDKISSWTACFLASMPRVSVGGWMLRTGLVIPIDV
jgi:hypothetical protein